MGRKCYVNQAKGMNRWRLGEEVGQILLGRGGDAILREVYGHAAEQPEQP